MSESTLRPTTEEDLPILSQLTETVFGRRRSPELLRWLLFGVGDGGGVELESKVATSGGRIVGHVAVLRSRYRRGDQEVIGSHPMVYMVAPEARGRAGVRLGRWCLSHGDFTMIVGGSPTSQAILHKRHFVHAARALELRVPTTNTGAGTSSGSELELLPYEPASYPAAAPEGPVHNLAVEEHLRWLAACPGLEPHLHTLYRGGTPLGPVLLYVDRRVDPPRGRIVHLPWLGEEWRPLLCVLLGELAAAGCHTASLLASTPELVESASALGGEVFHRRTAFYRRARGPAWQEASWHLTYLEADLAYRRI